MKDTTDSDESLVERSLAGSRGAFAALVTRHYDFIFATAWKWAGNREDAEDIAQDVCVRLARAVEHWRRQGAFRTWLYRVIVNATHDHHRRVTRNNRKLEAAGDDPTLPTHQSPDVERDDGPLASLWEAVADLPEKQRMSVLLVYGEGLNQSDAAKAMDCSPGTIGSNIHDAKKRLKAVLTPQPTASDETMTLTGKTVEQGSVQ